MSSGISTPLSQASTLINTPDFRDRLESGSSETSLPSSVLVEYAAAKLSSAIFIYDLAREAGFGPTSKDLQKNDDEHKYATITDVQSRAGAGLTLLGRLSESSSREGSRHSAALTAFTTPLGLAQMAPTLNLFRQPHSPSRLVLQVARATHADSDLTVSPTLSPLVPFFSSIPEHFTILLSATPQEIADFAAISYSISKSHVIHIFDHWNAAREISQKSAPSTTPSPVVLDTHTAIKKAGYEFFEYAGDINATNIVVLLNGPLALAIKSISTTIPSFGVVIVKVLRPWDEVALRNIIPSTTSALYVLDDVTSSTSHTPLYHDVLGGLLQSTHKPIRVVSQRVDNDTLNQLLVSAQSLVGYLSTTIPINWFAPPSVPPRQAKRVVFYSNSTSTLRDAPIVTSQLFISNPAIRSQLIQDFDAFSKPGGLVQSTLLLSSSKVPRDDTPASLRFDIEGDIDSLVVLDPSLLKTHDLFSDLRSGAPILVSTSWTPDEIVSNLSATNLQTIISKQSQIVTIDVDSIIRSAKESDVAYAVTISAFLRLYLGPAAKRELITHLTTSIFGSEVQGWLIEDISQATWDGLRKVVLPATKPAEEQITPVKKFSHNAVALPSPEANTSTSAIRSTPWTEAGKHVLFREAFAPDSNAAVPSQFVSQPALRPDIVEETFLVTCTVNRRLTPLEYNRNVFHLEFDTSRTGLKYEIGEALGVHGWNDTEEVLEFCSWYGLNPNDVISIPVPGDSKNRHFRTIFQAFQQQIDIFGKPPKGFYEVLSGHATVKEDQLSLRFIASAEGSSTFKKLSELETVTFVDVLQKFSSARPPVDVLCEIIGDIKPRHYSIASAQSAVGDRVDLLVVTVDWLTPSGTLLFLEIESVAQASLTGSPRFGQCTRYLAGLKAGQKVTVSIKPSVMKLPPDNMQPIIMAGLGTGYAFSLRFSSVS